MPGPAPAGALERVAGLARGVGLPRPAAVEVTPLPEGAGGIAFGPVVRLAPAPPALLLATLMHEAGHIGPVRQRAVEEAVADLTRRALLAAALAAGWPEAPALAPLLAPGPEGSEPASSHPMDPRTYRRAAGLAVALWQAAGGGAAASDPAAQASVLARAAALGRQLTSAAVLDLPRDPSDSAAFTRRHAAPLLAFAAAAAGPGSARVSAVEAALTAAPGSRDWRPYARLAAEGNETDRWVAHEVLSRVAPGPEGEDLLLDLWIAGAAARGEAASLAEARLRRGRRRPDATARDNLMAVLLEASAPGRAAAAAAVLGRGSSADAAGRLLDLAPALDACGAGGADLRGLALAAAGHPAAAVEWFRHGRGGLTSFGVTLAHAEALAATGEGSAAAALLRERGAAWRRAGRDPSWTAAASLAAALLDEETALSQVRRTARLLRRAGGHADGLLAEAARREQAAGRARHARRLWRQLLRSEPASDLAAEAREALSRPPADG